MTSLPSRPYNIDSLEREKKRFYINASEQEITEILEELELESLDDVYSDIPKEDLFKEAPDIGKELKYEELEKHVFEISQKNQEVCSFIGDGLTYYEPSPIVSDICMIRGLTTAYTPYQPEKSQGTLQSLWIYQNILSELTGFEGINASLYERSTGIFEAIKCALRLQRSKKEVLIVDSLYPGDKEVIQTLVAHTGINLRFVELDQVSGQANLDEIKKIASSEETSVLVFSQTTNLGTLEDVDALTDLASEFSLASIAVIDPILLANGGLKQPSHFGSQKQGVDIIVGEAQNLSLDKNFGGPGLGVFGIRYNEKNKNDIRQTPGRFVGKAKDIGGKDCKVMILSTREQHIRREKATSNICSNQSFVATLAGANLLHWGSTGLSQKVKKSRERTKEIVNELLSLQGITLAFSAPFFNEVSFQLEVNLKELMAKALDENLELGVDISDRTSKSNVLKIFISDAHNESDIEKLISFFKKNFEKSEQNDFQVPTLHSNYERTQELTTFKAHEAQEVIKYYQNLGKQNISPDDGVYPLGSCTMKYNPYINDYCASFNGFTKAHPQSHEKFVQGSLEILYQTQELFKAITGLAAVTTQPVAGAQGEMVGLKMFQAYHADKGEKRNIIIIPQSAHGTNPATAAIAGYDIVPLSSDKNGQISHEELDTIIEKHGHNIAGIMVTNPNTSGILEKGFKLMSKKIHKIGGLVYMDGANMNAIAGYLNLESIGVDAVHNNLHKTWTIPHGGGGPGDAIVAVSSKLQDFLPGLQIIKNDEGSFSTKKAPKSIGSFHRHWGNFAHKVRCYTYLKALGSEGVRKMSAFSVLSARYLFKKINKTFPTLPKNTGSVPRMHEFIITLKEETFEHITKTGLPKSQVIARIGKLFLDFGFHAPTVAFPEVYGLMIEPTESFSKKELDEFSNAVLKIYETVLEKPELLLTAPHFAPIARVDELKANRVPILREESLGTNLFDKLPEISFDKIKPSILKKEGQTKLLQLN